MQYLQTREEYKYLTRSTCYQLGGVSDVEEFERTVFAMQTVGLVSEEIGNIFQVVTAVLSLGNINFTVPKGDSEGAEVSKASKHDLDTLSNVLGVGADRIAESLCYRTTKSRDETYR
eukprot:GHVU01031862.1.p1 GENE.GHVU01031862.1~~GHVU01031862.1.p1  ORF type:complete len:117 (-),score=20.19 GHVU01031862.1:426-776(-)